MTEQRARIRKTMATVRAVEGVITLVVEIAGIALLLFMVAVVSIGVFTRYLLLRPVPWSDEAARFTLVWTGFLGAAVAVGKGSHFGILMLLNKFPRSIRQLVLLGTALGMAAFTFVLIRIGWNLMTMAAVQTSPALRLRMSWIYSAIPISGVLMLFYLVLGVIDLFTTDRAALGSDTIALHGEEH